MATELEEAKENVRQLQAQADLTELRNGGIQEFQNAITTTTDVYELGRLATNFAGKIQRIRSVLGQTDSKRGRKQKN